MAKILFIVVALSLVAALAKGDYTSDVEASVSASVEVHAPSSYTPKVDTTVIQGYVYCQGCNGIWVKHLAGAKVMAQCKNEESKSHGADLTDEYGFYQIKLPANYSPKSCMAKIVSSSDETCKVATNAGNGQQGATIAYLKTHHNEIFYKTSPFAFKPTCPSY